ncbi:transposase-like protein [Bacillus pakistanensis]|uniref:Transposase-like protein n=1 Tax=Rossellomorea pakistanensis TaxID=992288 RepID=A0ABS2NED0_9BACI|nr:transposase [Bacillus pakistanensis]MBM7586114.1 transposase-like protein [Bacillus pakistanensis]
MKRKRHNKEFKIQVSLEAIDEGNAASVARRYDLSSTMVNRWVNEYKLGKYGMDEGTTISYKNLSLENEKLKQLLGEKDLEMAILLDLIKNESPHLLKKFNKQVGSNY